MKYTSPESLQHSANRSGYYGDYGPSIGNGFSWLVINAYKLKSQTTGLRGGGINIDPQPVDTFEFLSPLEILENIQHTWETHESVASRIAATAISVAQGIRSFQEIHSAAGGLAEVIKGLWSGGNGVTAKDASSALSHLAGYAGAEFPHMKIDNPLVYMNSQRREIELTFTLVSEKGDPKKYVVDPIKRLQELSCPDIGDGVSLKPPHIFTIKTTGTEFINMTHSALRSVQPTYREPYYNGHPTRADLTLTFVELSPLYSDVIRGDTIITVNGSVV